MDGIRFKRLIYLFQKSSGVVIPRAFFFPSLNAGSKETNNENFFSENSHFLTLGFSLFGQFFDIYFHIKRIILVVHAGHRTI
jgi:hypothetical protein